MFAPVLVLRGKCVEEDGVKQRIYLFALGHVSMIPMTDVTVPASPIVPSDRGSQPRRVEGICAQKETEGAAAKSNERSEGCRGGVSAACRCSSQAPMGVATL